MVSWQEPDVQTSLKKMYGHFWVSSITIIISHESQDKSRQSSLISVHLQINPINVTVFDSGRVGN